jgi:hypothetical protein
MTVTESPDVPMGSASERAIVGRQMPERPSPEQHIVIIGDAARDDAPAHRPRSLLSERRAPAPDHLDPPELRRAYLPWTAFEDAFIRQEAARGTPWPAIAAALGRSPGSVRARLRRLGG